MLRRVRQQGHCPGALDGNGEPALVFLAVAALPVPEDLLPVVQVIPEEIHVLIVDDFDGVAAKITRATSARPAAARPPPPPTETTAAAAPAAETTSAAAPAAETTSAPASATTAKPSRRAASSISTISIKHQFSPIHILYVETGYVSLRYF